MKEKTVTVLFSGGLDSTYLIWKNLKEGNKVIPTYFEITNNKPKSIIEKQQIELLHKEFLKEFSNNKLTLINYATKISVINSDDHSAVNYPQPLIWALSIPFSIEKSHEVHVGYVASDINAISHVNEIKKLYDATKPFVTKFSPIKFPIIKKYKHDIANELPQRYQKLIISCEEPKLSAIKIRIKDRVYHPFEPCCRCEVCKKIIIDNYHDSDIIKENYKKNVIVFWKDRQTEAIAKTNEYYSRNAEKSIDNLVEELKETLYNKLEK